MQKDKKEYFLTIDCLTKLVHHTPKECWLLRGVGLTNINIDLKSPKRHVFGRGEEHYLIATEPAWPSLTTQQQRWYVILPWAINFQLLRFFF